MFIQLLNPSSYMCSKNKGRLEGYEEEVESREKERLVPTHQVPKSRSWYPSDWSPHIFFPLGEKGMELEGTLKQRFFFSNIFNINYWYFSQKYSNIVFGDIFDFSKINQ